jgi:hypothetical protein
VGGSAGLGGDDPAGELAGRGGANVGVAPVEQRTRHGTTLLRVWLRAEGVRHLVVLRAHLLRPAIRDELAALAAAAGLTVWLVWHRRDPPPPAPAAAVIALPWIRAATLLRTDIREHAYRGALAAARREAALWRDHPPRPRLRRFAHPGCALAAVIQRLTIDAVTRSELQVRLHVVAAGFAAEGVQLTLPAATAAATAALGPRLSPHTITRLRQLACPSSVAALMLALAADAAVACLNGCTPHLTSPDGRTVRTLGGLYRIPPRARPLLRAAVIAHQELRGPAHSLLIGTDGSPIGRHRMLHLLQRVARLTGLEVPRAVVQAGTGLHAAMPFASDYILNAAAAVPDEYARLLVLL